MVDQQPPSSPPAGWYPTDDRRMRWWNGAAWTDHFQPVTTPSDPKVHTGGRLLSESVPRATKVEHSSSAATQQAAASRLLRPISSPGSVLVLAGSLLAAVAILLLLVVDPTCLNNQECGALSQTFLELFGAQLGLLIVSVVVLGAGLLLRRRGPRSVQETAVIADQGTSTRRTRPIMIGLLVLILGIGIGVASAIGVREPAAESSSGLTAADLDERESDLDSRESELASQQGDLEVTQQELDDRETSLSQAEDKALEKQIEGNGNYEVGVDVKPGTYKNPDSGDSCYWSINSDPNGSNIIQNNGTGGPQTFAIRKGQYLELSNCEGTFTKVG